MEMIARAAKECPCNHEAKPEADNGKIGDQD